MSSQKGTDQVIGIPHKRIDGRAKVTGAAKYSGDMKVPGLLHVAIFTSTIPSGIIKSMDLREARAVPGVVEILTHENAPALVKPKKQMGGGAGESFWPLQTNEVYYNGQQIGAVIAETLEAAEEACRRVKITYNSKPAKLDFDGSLKEAHVVKENMGEKVTKSRGDVEKGLAAADARIASTYIIPNEHHNPMEPSATVATLKDGKLLVYDATQGVSNSASQFTHILKMKSDDVTTITKFIGGGFGCKGSFWPHQAIAAMATVKTKCPVKVVLTREQMFTGVGYRARSLQTIELGAKKDGELTAIRHISTNKTAINNDFTEPCTSATPMLYKCANVDQKQQLVPLNYMAPTFMRAPGHSTGSFSLESAMDELAVKLKMDPLDLRLKNYAEEDQDKKKPFTSKSLRECYTEGSRKFDWSKRASEPRLRRDGDWWIGHGMATATYPAQRFNAMASVVLKSDGHAEVRSATQDIGTGTYTIMTQIAAQNLGLRFEQVSFDLGNSKFPASGVSGGSTTASSVGSAIKLACDETLQQLRKLAVGDKSSPLHGLKADELRAENGVLLSKNGDKSETYASLLTRNGGKEISGDGKVGMFDIVKGKMFGDSGHAFGAQFAEVRVHARTGEVRLNRLCGAFACGKILNPLTAQSQFEGGMIFGIGMALLEETPVDLRNGRLAVKDLADYHVPVQMDVPQLDVIMVDEVDTKINPIGTKGIGEIGITGVAAAIANAVFNATGVRLRELPLTPDKVLKGLRELDSAKV